MKRIQRKRSAGWKKPAGAINITRPGKWGNPFEVKEHGREEAVRLFERAIETGSRELKFTTDEIKQLRGKDLMCWCKPGDLCHGDVLLKLANTA